MPTYEYEFTDHMGGTVDVWQRMSADALTTIEGRPVRRVISGGVLADAKMRADRKYPYVSNRHAHLAGAPQTGDGKPVILSQRHEREVAARNNLRRE